MLFKTTFGSPLKKVNSLKKVSPLRKVPNPKKPVTQQ